MKVSDHAIPRRVVETGDPFLQSTIDLEQLRDLTTAPYMQYVESAGLHSLIVVALRAQGRPIGILSLARHRGNPRPFGPEDVTIAGALADHAALAVTNARLIRHVRQVELAAANAALIRQQEAFDRFFMLSLDLLCIAGVDGYFRRLNPAFESTLGWTLDELTGRPFLDFVHPDDVAATVAEVGKLSTGIPTIKFENRYRCKDGSYRWLAWTSAPDPDGTLFAVARDVTAERHAQLDLQRAKDDAERANAELETFSYSVSHDLRAPLRAIDGFARILAEDHGEQLDPEAMRVVGVIRTNTLRMGQLIDDLLQFSRLGRRELVSRAIDMEALARSAAEEILAAAAGRAIDLRVEPMPSAVGDPSLFRQVWINLIGNATKYTRDQAPAVVTVRGASVGRDLVYSVADNGVGFDMRYVDKLFGVFQRLHAATEFEGTGVGLALVRRIVQRHGGRAWAEGMLGQGATFSFSLPLRKGEES
jgi:PAS domain S-box-containing protein